MATVQEAINQAAERYGVPSDALTAIARLESGLNPQAKNPRSSAAGLFQFINSTARDYGLTNPYDPVAAADAGARLARDNANALRSALGREPTAGELYLAHQQGAAGAIRILRDPTANAASVLGGEQVRLNVPAGQDWRSMTTGDFANLWTNKLSNAMGGQPVATFASSSVPTNTNPGIIPQRPANLPSFAPVTPPSRPVHLASAPVPPQRPGMLGGLLNAGQNAMNAVQGVRQGVQQTAQNVGGSIQGNPIARAMLGNQVRGFWSNPNMGTVISRDPIQGRQGVAVQTVGQGGGQMAYATPSMRSGSSRSSINSPEAVVRRANSAAIREATGSGAISKSSIADSLNRGATLVRRA